MAPTVAADSKAPPTAVNINDGGDKKMRLRTKYLALTLSLLPLTAMA